MEYFRECMPFLNFPIPTHMTLVLVPVILAACPLVVGMALGYRAGHCGTQATYPYQLFNHSVNKRLKQRPLIHNTQTCTRPYSTCTHKPVHVYICLHRAILFTFKYTCTRVPTGTHTYIFYKREENHQTSKQEPYTSGSVGTILVQGGANLLKSKGNTKARRFGRHRDWYH